MAKPSKTEFHVGGKHLTTVVMDKEDYDSLCDSMIGIINGATQTRVADTDTLKKANHIPLMMQGTKTKHIFTQFEIATQYASFIVRGEGMKALNKILFSS